MRGGTNDCRGGTGWAGESGGSVPRLDFWSTEGGGKKKCQDERDTLGTRGGKE